MVLLRGIIKIVCPETGKEVKLHEDCQKADEHGNPCPYYKHFGIRGPMVVVACSSIKTEFLDQCILNIIVWSKL